MSAPFSSFSFLNRLSVKLGLVLFGVVAVAMAIVYLAVLPRLESRLVDAKIDELERAAPSVADSILQVPKVEWEDPVTRAAESLDARVIVFDVRGNLVLPYTDSAGNLSSTGLALDPVVLEAVSTGEPAKGRVKRDGHDLAEAAVPSRSASVTVLVSASLGDALANVRTVRRSVLLAGGIALIVSWLAGYLVSMRFARRLQRLEAAAERIAGGDFSRPIEDPGRDEVGELARALDSMRVRLAHLDRARKEFIANASHELRTPLFSLGGFLELMDDEDVDEETRGDFLEEMRAQVERLTRLAIDLLDLSRLDAGQLEVEIGEIELVEIARTVCEEFRGVAEAEGHDLSVADGAGTAARGDEQRVLQIGRILVENAIRHTPPGTAVELVVGARDDSTALAVRDEGPGIPEEERAQVFERFYRGEGGRAFGSGLGLAIAWELAAKMGGSIDVSSQPGETVFTLRLPRAEGAPFSHENGVGHAVTTMEGS